jgi:hypothetical protein
MAATGPSPVDGGDLDCGVHRALAAPRRMVELLADRNVTKRCCGCGTG